MIQKREIENASHRLSPFIHETPLFKSAYVNQLFEAEIFFKAENLQKTGSFKARGALNSILQLDSGNKQYGVATHSSGNHGQALAWAAKSQNIPCYVVMPENAPSVKIAAVKDYGAEVRFCEANLKAREVGLQMVLDETSATFVPPYNYHNTIVGQSTCAYEVFNQMREVDFLLAPVGGGGLLSGSALSAHWFSPNTQVIGCEPAMANDAWQSFNKGEIVPSVNPKTIADGLRTSLGDITFSIISQLVTDILLCSEESILKAMRMIWERLKLVVEPSAAVPLACIMENPEFFKGKKLVIILSGGNIDLDQSPFKKT